ncbi:outer membrane immunogenic protein [Bradyrhizobium sp. LB7.2]|jgi:outer membrane immunogenic protein|uniref:outer membrane protein n=2 Tax=Bradyrhizobium TaxID=374 RepID=UPI001FFC0A4A|nr:MULTISPECIES: outer membrane beta-barrel protein [unclassified Bradyrhizobium]MCK1338528.1 porin family protein [Bradyrhizobium sp. 38]MCK1475208.1 porin family protein [Bradyrhizobium sp. 197]MCK1781905.1 porin family protein [Bradyrhizobium sp. 132]
MKKLLVAAAGTLVLGLSAPASAADLAARPYTKAPPMVAAIYDWSGFYIGINGGGGSSHKCWDFVDATGVVTGVPGALAAEGCHNAVGGTVGGQIGYRMQSGQWVFGIEGQGNWADFSGDNVSAIPGFGTRNRSRIDSFGLITGQVGYAWNNVLFYVKGGAAVVGDKYDVFDIPTGALFSSARETRWGGTVGAGLEYGFAPNWSVGVEYNHIFLGDRTIDFTTPIGGFAGSDRIRQDVDMGLVRVNYRWGGPSIAHY